MKTEVPEKASSHWTTFLKSILVLFAILLLIFYWFIPFEVTEFEKKSGNSNFSNDNYKSGKMQFYANMRYPSSKISYKIDSCTLQKKYDMEEAFRIMSNKSILNFYPKSSEEDISITCDSKNKIEGGLFIAGEGGPTNITITEKFNVILHGKILLIRKSECERPNVALHELLHVLGFEHSSNPENIMYNTSKCRQTIGADITELINKLYSTPSYSDLAFENVSAVIHGRYLDTNMSIRNHGLKESEETKIMIYTNDNLVKEINLKSLKIGHGKIIMLSNIWISKRNIQELRFLINSSSKELEKDNNKITLKTK